MEKMLLAGIVAGITITGGAVVGGVCKIAYEVHKRDRLTIDVQRATIKVQNAIIKGLLDEDKKTEA